MYLCVFFPSIFKVLFLLNFVLFKFFNDTSKKFQKPPLKIAIDRKWIWDINNLLICIYGKFVFGPSCWTILLKKKEKKKKDAEKLIR